MYLFHHTQKRYTVHFVGWLQEKKNALKLESVDLRVLE
jgi:hypothetical protein